MEARGGLGQFDLKTSPGALAMVYLDADGSLGERLSVLDSQDPKQIELRGEIRSARPTRRVAAPRDVGRQPSRAFGRQPGADRRPRGGGAKDVDAGKFGKGR
jgi:hypothetical protein